MGESESLTLRILKQIRNDVGEVKGKVVGLEGKVIGLEGKVVGLEGKVDGLRVEVERNTARLGTVEHVVNDLASQMAFVSKHVRNSAKRHAATERKVEDLTTRVIRLERHGGPKKP